MQMLGELSDLSLDDVLKSVPKREERAAKAAYEAMRTKMGLVRLRPWDDLLVEERLVLVSFVMMGAQVNAKRHRR